MFKVLHHVVLLKNGFQLPPEDTAEAGHIYGVAHLKEGKGHRVRPCVGCLLACLLPPPCKMRAIPDTCSNYL